MSLAFNRIPSTRYVAALPPRDLGGLCAPLSATEAYDEVGRSIADVIEHSIERLAPVPGERLLDIGTGSGWAARRMAERQAKARRPSDPCECTKFHAEERLKSITGAGKVLASDTRSPRIFRMAILLFILDDKNPQGFAK